MNSTLRKTLVHTGYVLSAVVLITGILVVIAYLLTLQLNYHRVAFQNQVSVLLQKPITMDHIKLGWYHYYYPELDLENVNILDEQTQKPNVAINHLRMKFNLWDSLWRWQLVLRSVTIKGVNITVTQEASGMIQIQNLVSFNLHDTSTGALLQPNRIMQWILTQRRLTLENIVLHFVMNQQPEQQVQLQSMILENNGSHHVIDGSLLLGQQQPATLNAHFDWNGDIQTYLIADGNLQLDLKNLNLSQWISHIAYKGFEVKDGLVTGHLSIDWKNNQWVTSHFIFQGNTINVENNGSTPLLIHSDRVSADLNLRHNEKIAVVGNINVANGAITLPNKKLSLTAVNGTVQLSDKGMLAKNISSLFMNEPTIVNIDMPNVGHQANELHIALTSRISANLLEQIVNLPLSRVIEGSADYGAQLTFNQDNPKANKMVIQSNLKGLAIKAPSSFGKTADQSKDLTVTVLMPTPSNIDIKAKYGKDMQLSATETDKQWSVNISSDWVAGNITVPSKFTGGTLNAHLQYLHYSSLTSPKSSQGNSKLHPIDLPGLSLECDDLKVNEYALGHVILNTSTDKEGMIIKQFTINNNLLQLNATGSWTNKGSHLEGHATSPKISDLLIDWGFKVENFAATTANMKFNFNWNDAVYNPTLSNLNGDMTLHLGPGTITGLSQSTNQKIGLANLLNIFSLTQLPELNLNSDNLSKNGYVFQSVNAQFQMHAASLKTNNIIFISPIADIAIKGRIGLDPTDLDLEIGVTPHLTGSLPLIATLAGGPLAGAATWAVSHVMSGDADPSKGSNQYIARGPWSKPVITKVGASHSH